MRLSSTPLHPAKHAPFTLTISASSPVNPFVTDPFHPLPALTPSLPACIDFVHISPRYVSDKSAFSD
jgi:hypothetical protein